MKEIIKINGMSCASCSSTIEKNLRKKEGVKSANVNLLAKELYVEYENIDIKEIKKSIKDMGYKVEEEKGNYSLLASILLTIPTFFTINGTNGWIENNT